MLLELMRFCGQLKVLETKSLMQYWKEKKKKKGKPLWILQRLV